VHGHNQVRLQSSVTRSVPPKLKTLIRRRVGVAPVYVCVAAAVWLCTDASAQPVASSGEGYAETIAVEVFTNVTGSQNDSWIGNGIAEAVAANLGGTTTGGDIGAQWVIRGGYQRIRDNLRITAELVDVSSGLIRNAVKVDGVVSDLFSLQDELSRRLAAMLRTESVTPIDNGTRPTAPDLSSVRATPSRLASMVPGRRDGFHVPPSRIVDGPPPPIPPEVVSRDSQGRITMRAIRLDSPLQIDGRLTERVYRDVVPVTDFVQQEPDEGAPATDETEIWVMFHGDILYVSARCWSTDPERIVANDMKRDSRGMFGNETFAVVLDTYYDRRNAFNFMTNALGGLFDATITNERIPNMDWNTVWDVRTGRFDQGWTVEIAIPFKSLRYRPGPSQVWGINIQRRVASKNETSFLTQIPASLSMAGLFKISSAATLVGLEIPASGTRLETKPYAISTAATNLDTIPSVVNRISGNLGVDVKYGVTQGLTADLTYNTDFAQVEVDEQQVNLTRFRLFFPEKREFFLEGQGIFEFGGGFSPDPTTFYFSGERFGGAAPVLFFSRRIGLGDRGTIPIRGGGRLTGKVGPYSIGLLDVQTGDDSATGTMPTNFSVVRVKRDVLRRSAIGALFTGRSVSIDGVGTNRVYGIDGTFSFYDNLNINSYLAKSETSGLSGNELSYQTQLDYTGDRWGVKLDRLVVAQNFNPELGFIRREDFRRNFGSLRFSPRPTSIQAIRKILFEASLDYTTDNAGLLETRIHQSLFGVELENGDRFFTGVTRNYEFLKKPFLIANDSTIPVGGYSFVNTRVVYALGQQRVISGGVAFDRGTFFGGDRTSIGYFNGRMSLTSQLTVEPSLSLNWINLPQGSFTTELVGTRTTYTITPRMFVAGLLQFNSGINSLGTNFRFRWEYQPGSELFVVYTDERDTLTPRFPTLENRAFIVKITRLFRF